MAETMTYVATTRFLVIRRWFGSSLIARELRSLDEAKAVPLFDQIKKSLIPGESVELWNSWTRKKMIDYTEPKLGDEDALTE